MRRLEIEISKLQVKHPEGFSVRLHILGDFFSVEYVQFWERMLAEHDGLHVYGYTHRIDEIHDEIDRVWMFYGARFNIFQSDGGPNEIRPVALIETTEGADKLPTCPEQTGKAQGCLDCGLCTLPNVKGVKFLIH